MAIGSEVRKARVRLKLSQAAYAKRVGVTQASISRIEAGKSGTRGEVRCLDKLLRRGGLRWTDKGPRAAL